MMLGRRWNIMVVLDPSRARKKEKLQRTAADWIFAIDNLLIEKDFDDLHQNPATKGFCFKLRGGVFAIHEMVGFSI
jgi:hypothetical protein